MSRTLTCGKCHQEYDTHAQEPYCPHPAIKGVRRIKYNYKAGARFENRVKDWYEDQGHDAIRAAGSHGLSDVTSFFSNIVIFNTLRINNYWTPVEREQFEALCKRHCARGRYVWRASRSDGYKICFKEVE